MTMMTMKAAVIRESGAPEVLAIEELPVPQPAPGWVGRVKPTIGRVFQLDDIVEAHRSMESNVAAGKLVVLT